MLPRDKKIFLLIDAVDQLAADSHRDTLDFLPDYSANIHYLVTCANEFELPKSGQEELISNVAEVLPQYLNKFLAKRFAKIFPMPQENELPLLEEKEVGEVLKKILQRSGKNLFPETKAEVYEKGDAARNPFYLEIIAQVLLLISSEELMQIENPEDIVGVTVKFVKKLSVEPKKAAVEIINEAMTRPCDEEFKPTLRQAVNLIAVSRHGLRFRDLQAILGDDFQELDFSRLKKYLSAFFIQRDTDGRIDFAHIISREGVRADLTAEDFKRLENKLADYLATLPVGDTVRAAEGFYFAKRTRNFKFAVDLLDEADLKRNSSLIQDIYLATLADDGDFFTELLNTHLNKETLNKETLVKVSNFFIGVFNTMFNGGAREYNLAIRLIDAFSANSFKTIDFEMIKIRMQMRLGKFKDAEKTLLDIDEQIKNISVDKWKNDTEFCRNMSFY